MPTLYVREVPKQVYEALRRRARKNGRSINHEALAILEQVAAEERDYESIVDKLEALAREINLPPDAPRSEELIRQARDERARRP